MNDELMLLNGGNYKINDKIYIKQPTLNDIFIYGEQEYFSMISALVSIPSDMKSVLFDMGVDYENISDFEFFIWLCKKFDSSITNILFGEQLNFEKMNVTNNPKNQEIILTNATTLNDIENSIVIDFYIYNLMVSYIRKMHGFTKKVEKAGNEYTKNILIEEDRENRKNNADFKSFLKPLIISMVNCADFPYDFNNVWNLPISVFIESVQQVQKYKNAGHLLQGIYSGSIDGTKLNKDNLRWI
ncbi:MAG: hypothetical protein RR806_03145 [Oscillospiraceae bacterium]